jgi:hypothetical protein
MLLNEGEVPVDESDPRPLRQQVAQHRMQPTAVRALDVGVLHHGDGGVCGAAHMVAGRDREREEGHREPPCLSKAVATAPAAG